MTVGISNAAAGELAWTATRLGSSPWLSLAAASGTAPGTLDATADPRGLGAGVYEDTIVVTARSPARGEARIAIQFVIHPCRLGPTPLNVELTGRLEAADCAGPHRSAMFADLYSFTGSAGDSVSVELESTDFAPYLILDTAAAPSASPLAETGHCAYAPGEPCLRYQRLPRTGTFVLEVTTAAAGDSGAYRLRLFQPRPPSPVGSLAQLGGDSTSVISTGGVIADSTIVLSGTANDPDGGDSLRLEVEIRPVDEPFTGSATIAGAFVPAGSRAFVRAGVNDNTAYHWRARVADQTGRTSPWSDFGGNAGSSPDVSVAVNDSPSAPTELGQFEGDPLARIVVGGVTDEAAIVFRGTVLDPDPGDSVRLEVEVRALGTPFTGLPTASGALVASGTIASVTMGGLADQTQYHWQVRAVDRSGRATAWTSFGDNTEATTDFHVSLPKAPAQPVDPGQFRVDGVTAIAAGDTIPERSIRLRATLTDANLADQLRLEMELQPFGVPFADVASGTSEPVASGEVATVVITGVPENTSYHWQARVVDQSGRASAWTAFGPNPGTPDFHVRVPATQLVFTVQPAATGSGAAIAPAVRVAAQDGEGNTLASFTGPISVALSNNPAGGALAGTLTVNAVAGIATFADLRIDRAGIGYSLVASATNGGPTAATSDVFGVTPGAAARLAITTAPSSTASSGVALAQQPVIQLLDAAGNAVSQAGIEIQAAIVSGGGTLGGTTIALTNSSGVAEFTDLLIAGSVGLRTLEFTGPELSGVTSGAVAVTPGAPATLIKSLGDSLIGEAGSALGTAHEVTVLDAYGNPVVGVPVSWAVNAGGSVSPALVTTDVNGRAAAIRTLGGIAGAQTTTATAVLSGVPTSVTFHAHATAGAATQMSMQVGDLQTDTVGQTLPAALAVRVADQFNNPVPNTQITWAVLEEGGSVNPPTSLTDASGIATTSWTLGTAMTPTDSVQLIQATGAGSPVTFTAYTVPGPVSASQTRVTASPALIAASNGSSATTLTITVRDAFGNVIKGKPVALTATGTGNTLSQPAATSVNGVTTGILAATVAEQKTVSATIEGVEITQAAEVVVTPAGVSGDQSTITVAPGVLPASSGASSAAITVTARDPFGNLIPGATVVLAATGLGNTLTHPATTTDGNGVTTGSLSATAAGAKVISATIDEVAVAHTATVAVVAAVVDGAQSTLSVAPGSIVASSGANGAAIIATARDQFGNPIAGATVVLAATGSGNLLTQPAITDANGVATGSLSATTAGEKVVSATIGGTGVTQTATVMVAPADISAEQSTLTVAPGTLTASSGASNAIITVTARDQFGNAIPGALVVLVATGTGNTLTQPESTTDANGSATGTLSATGAGAKLVSATIGGTGVTQTVTVPVLPAGVSAEQSTVAAAPAPITAGSETTTITVTARDQFSNPIEGATVVLSATGTGNALVQPLGPTGASGVATGALSATGAGEKIISATISGTGVTQTTAVTVNAAGVSAAQSQVFAEPATLMASTGASSTTITVTARDQFDNPIPGATVVLAATGSGNTLSQPSSTTDANGVATGSLSATTAEGKTVAITIDGTTVMQTAAVMVTPAEMSAGQSTVSAGPAVITASDGASSATITVTARDQFGNPIQGAAVVLVATGSGNTVAQPASTTDASGVAIGAVSSTVAETKTISVTIGGMAGTPTAAVTVTPAGVSAAQSAVSAAPGAITASQGASSTTITVTARDQFGNPIEGATVLLAASGTGNALTQPGTTDASGLATGALSATVAEDKLVSAMVNGTPIAQTVTVTTGPAGVDAAQSTVVGAPGSITAGAGVATITVSARDQFGNPIPGAAVALTASGTGNTVTQPPATNETGVATGLLSATVAEGKIVAVTIDGVGITQTAAVAVTPASVSATQSTVAATPAAIVASSGASSATVTVTARDQFGNPIEGAAVVLTASGGGNTVTQPTTTNAAGVATGTLSATVAEGKTVAATIDGTGITQTAAVTVTPAGISATQSTLTAASGAITASEGTSSTSISVTARDAFGNPIQGATVVLAASGSGNTLTQPPPTDASGLTIGTLSATAVGDRIVSASIDGTGVTQTATVLVTPAGVSAEQSTVSAAPGTIVAGSDLATITVTARDPFGNPIPGATVVLTATGSGNTLTQPAGSTNAAGATTATLSSTAAETKTVSATINGHAITQTATVSVGHAGVDAAQSTVTAAPETIIASDGTSTATISVTARDQFGNPIEGVTVMLAATGNGNSLSQPAPTNAGGVTTATLSATGAGARVISATIEGTGVTQTATVLVTPASVSAEQSTVSAAPGTIVASSGSGSTTVTVAARDAFGNPIPGATVVLAATGTGNTVTQPGPTEATGIASGTLSSTAAGDKVVSATINGTGVGQTVIISVLAAAVSSDQSTVIASPGTVTASNGSSSATITVTARDQFGNPIEGRAVALAASGTANSLTQPATTTDANGIATGTLTATMAETKTVTASVDGLLITQQAIVLVTPAAAQQLVFRVQPASVTAGANLAPAVEVEILDEFANRVTSAANAVALAIATNPAGGTLTGGDAVVAVDGIASFAGLSMNKAGSGYTLQASSPGLTGATSSGFTVTPGAVSADQSTVAVTPGSITAGSGLATITVTARDAFGNPIEGAAVVLEATGAGNTLIQPATTTDANGVATGTLSATGAGDKLISAAIAGTGVTQTATVTVEAAGVDPAQSTVLAAPEAITASNGASSATIMVTARDQFGNPIAGATVLLAASGTGNALTQPGTATDLSGLVTGTLSATAAGSKTVTATIDDVPITQQANVLVTPAAADHLVFLVQPTDVRADANITPPVEVEIRDPFGNRATSAGDQVNLAIASNPGGGTLTGGGPVGAVSGVASFAAINVNKVGAGYILAAASPGLGGATSDPFTVTAGAVSPVQSTVIAAPASIPVGSGVTTITVTARDANDNPIPSATVVLAAAGTAPVLTQPAVPTATDGTATGTLSATLSGGKTVSAVINGTPIAQTAIVAVQPPPGSVVLVGAGDIADCAWTTDEATAALLDTIPGTVFTAGDNAYPDGTTDDFANCYEPTWGRHKARTRPSPGNHDYRTQSATAYYAYFGANAGSGGWGFYSYDLGDWHIIALNSEIGMTVGSTQEVWLRNDLAANTKQCTLAYWHRPLFSSGEHGNLVKSKPIWQALQEYNAEVVVVGHDHNYERFAPQDTLGIADPDRGLREFVVGTGGTDLRSMNAPVPNSEVRNSDTHGVVKFTLYSTGYEWEFVPIAGKTFTDSGSGTCH